MYETIHTADYFMQIVSVYCCLLFGTEICDHDVDSNSLFMQGCLSLLCDAICVCLYSNEFYNLHHLLISPLGPVFPQQINLPLI